MSTADLRERMLAVVREHGPISANTVVATVRCRRADIPAAFQGFAGRGAGPDYP